MKAKLLGCKLLNFTTREGDVKGTKVFYSSQENGVTGLSCGSFFVKDENKEILAIDPVAFIGKEINLDFNQKGNVTSVSA